MASALSVFARPLNLTLSFIMWTNKTKNKADAITDYVFRDLIPSANSEELLSLLSFLSQRVFGRAPPRLAAAGVAAETAALRAFVVAAIKAGNPKAALDLLAAKAHELMGADASSAADWAPWYALPHLSGSSSASFVFPRCSRALNDPAWAREAEATFRNALAEAACALPPPALLRLGRAGNRSEKEVAARAAELEAENARLRARVEALERACGADGVAASAAGAATKSVRAATSNGGGRGEKATAGSAAAAAPSRARTATTPPPPRAAAAAAPLAASPPMWSWSPASSSLTK